MTDHAPPRTVFEAFGHHDTCSVWREDETEFHLDRNLPCSCEVAAPSAVERPKQEEGVDRIARERARQVAVEHWTPEHDDRHSDGTLTAAACCYAMLARRQADGTIQVSVDGMSPPAGWPWDEEWWKPSDQPVRNLEKAGALIAAEIDRLLRGVK